MNFDIVGGKETKFPGIAVSWYLSRHKPADVLLDLHISLYLKFDVHIAG